MTKREWKNEINDVLETLDRNDRYIEDCQTVIENLKDCEVEYLAQKTQKQYDWDFDDAFDIVEKRIKLKLALFSGAIPHV